MKCRSYIKHPRFRKNITSSQFTPKQLAAFYGFPPNTTGIGKKVAVIELGGAYNQGDLDTYFKSLGLTVKPVVFHSIDGGQNTSDGPDGADGEVMLDLCVIGAMAPGVEMHCYTAPNTDQGFLDAINQAITDKMDCISISWGAPEDQWSGPIVTAFNAAFQKAGAAGITVTVAAGDNGSTDGEIGNHVDFPASSPFVLACGGTSVLSVSPVNEVVWNDGSAGGATGGGVSGVLGLPTWQSKANVPGGRARGVPDVAGNADPNTGWIIMIDGQQYVIGGTSAVAPMWAALAACLSQVVGNVGFLNPFLYNQGGWARDIVSGNNGTYTSRVGWDACTGNGVPIGTKLLAMLQPTVPPTPPTPPTPPKPTQHTIVVTGSITVDGKPVT
ncbi:Subtilase family protein [uncultured archaeon]|nr:Subtilase family protein [uncultured archaeon]